MRMKKIFTFLCAALMTLSAVQAEVLFTEHFAQTTETLATNTDALPYSGEIAATGWTNIMGGSGDIYMNTSSDLTYTGYKSKKDDTGSAEFKASYGRRVAAALSKEVNSGSVFMAGIVKITAVEGSGKDYIWSFGVGTSGLNAATSKHYARPFVQASGSGFKLGLAKLNEVGSSIDYSDELAFGTYLIVTEYTWVEGDQNDEVKLYINPTKGDKPATAALTPKVASTKADAASFGSVILYSSSSSKAACLIDELKVVTSWAELWESDEPVDPTPAIIVDNVVDFGKVTLNETVEKKITVKGENLISAIGVQSGNHQLVVSTESISKAEAEAEGGYELTLTVTPDQVGDKAYNLLFSAENADYKVVSVKWNAVEPVVKKSIAEAKALAAETEVALNDVVVIRVIDDYDYSVQDATGAINIVAIGSWQVGDKISDLTGITMVSDDYVEGFNTIYCFSGTVAASGVAVEPFAVSLSDFTKYGPALVKVEGVSFPSDKETFEAGGITISQDAASANLQILTGCDIIGEEVPSTADVKGVVCHPYLSDNIVISSSADVYNRVPKSGTGIINTVDGNKARKVIRDGQLIIVRDGKEFNVIGTQL